MKYLLVLVFLLSGFTSFSQGSEGDNDLKVGLVLSGGGAKGLAHVAVLKVLEEAGVRVDYIGGTSMGAIIGALYASGYDANELDSIVRSINFDNILSDDIPRKALPFYEKEIGEKYALSLPIKNGRVGVPLAISSGQNVLNLLTELTEHVNQISNFSELPIPFVCVATDLESGDPVVLRNGFLPEAVKASGSFPTLLAPVEIDGKLLSDGGIVNNFPVDEVKEMGADIIIGVDIQSGLEDKDQLYSFVRIINQIVGFQMYKTLERKYEDVDLLLKPNMDAYNVLSFDEIDAIMKEGALTARSKIDDFKRIASMQLRNEKSGFNTQSPRKFHIKKVEVEGNSNYTRAYILGKLNIKNRDSTSYKKLVESVDNLNGTQNFESIQYRINNEDDGSIIRFKVKENAISNYLRLAIHYDELYKTGILINTTAKHLFYKNDVISGDLILGDNIRYNLNYFIDNGFYTSFGIRSRYNSFESNIRFDEANVNKINLEYEDFTNQLYFQTVFNRKFAIGVGSEWKRIKAYTETISSVDQNLVSEDERLYFDKSNYYNLIAYMKLDTYDKKYFQKQGAYLDANLTWYVGSSDFLNNFTSFSQIKGKAGAAYTFFDKLTFHLNSEAGITIGDNENRALDFNLGGHGENFINNLVPFYGYDLAELSNNSFLRSAFTLRYELFKNNYLSATANFARVEKDIFEQGRLFDNTKSGYMVGYGVDTFLGPIEINYTWSPDHKENYWYFNVGYWF